MKNRIAEKVPKKMLRMTETKFKEIINQALHEYTKQLTTLGMITRKKY